MTLRRILVLLTALTVLLAGCAGGAGDAGRDGAAGPASATDPAEGGWLGEESERDWDSGAGESAAYAARAGGVVGTETDAASTASLPEGAPAPPAVDVPEMPLVDQSRTGLRAGSVDDNEGFADYLRYREEFARLGLPVHDIDITERHVVTVVDRGGRPVLGAVVRAGDQEVRTYADGRALLFGPIGDEITVGYGEETARVDPADGTQPRVVLPVRRPEGRARLDVLFLIDTTGSMGDEIDRLKASVDSVARRIGDLEARPDLHLGMTLYRDRGDVFVTRTFDFTSDVGAFRRALAEVRADGGGDTPEDLNAGLHEALNAPSWRGDDTVKLVFLVADAPPQLYADGPDYAGDVRDAARRGIKIEPIASSGLDDQGEFVFRQLAQLTMGRFTFLTYGADGVSPGESTTHHVSDYAVLALDDLVVRLVGDELAAVAPSGQ